MNARPTFCFDASELACHPPGLATMAATTGIAGSGEPDMALIAELLENISRNPPATAARKLLVEHYISVGWLEAAMDNAKELKTLVPADVDVARFLQILQKKPDPPAPERLPTSASAQVSKTRVWDPITGRYQKTTAAKQEKNASEVLDIELNGDLEAARRDLTQGYQALRAKAKFVLQDLINLQSLQKRAGMSPSKNTAQIQSIATGDGHTPGTRSDPPGSARSVARTIRDNPQEATNLAIADLQETMEWTRNPYSKPSGINNDAIRDILVKRSKAIHSTLPDDLKIYCEHALMHIEHEHLGRNYANTETMYLGDIKDVPRANFYVTEDNYAWDMEELVQALTANEGVLRNPLSREMFTPRDVKGILLHPLGKTLAALGVEQHEMSKGVRVDTIVQLERLSQILLEDQSADTVPSRKAVDEFLAYIATCMSPLVPNCSRPPD
jgi:hypothetical protein